MLNTRGPALRAQHALVVALAIAGCAHALPAPDSGGPPWLEARSAHFALRTDLPADEARHLLLELEELRAVQAALLPAAEPAERIEVYAPASQDEQRALGLSAASDAEHESLFGARALHVKAGPRLYAQYAVVRGLARLRIAGALPRLPAWLAQGLERYLMRAYRQQDGSVVCGADVPELSQRRRAAPLPVSQALEWDGAPAAARHGEDRERQLDALHWAIVQHLATNRANGFSSFLQALADGRPARAAFEAAFADLTDAALDAELAAVARSGVTATLATASEAPGAAPVLRTLDAAEVHALRAEAFALSQRDFAARDAASEAQAALRSDAAQPLGLSLVFAAQGAQGRERDAAAATQAHPNDARAWMLRWAQANGIFAAAAERAEPLGARLGRAFAQPALALAAERASLDKAAALAPDAFLPVLARAAVALRAGERDAARAAASEAQRRRPQSAAAAALLAAASHQ